jgi:uncharacterized membrane protein
MIDFTCVNKTGFFYVIAIASIFYLSIVKFVLKRPLYIAAILVVLTAALYYYSIVSSENCAQVKAWKKGNPDSVILDTAAKEAARKKEIEEWIRKDKEEEDEWAKKHGLDLEGESAMFP